MSNVVPCSCIKDHSMFKKKRLMVNKASKYERIRDNEEEKEPYSPFSSGDVSEDSPIVPAN